MVFLRHSGNRSIILTSSNKSYQFDTLYPLSVRSQSSYFSVNVVPWWSHG